MLKLSKRSKINTVIFLVCVIMVSVLAIQASPSKFSSEMRLFSGLPQEDAIKIMEKLSDMHVNATYRRGNIYVPVHEEQRVREQLISASLTWE